MEKALVHISTIKHERRVPPNGFVVILIILVEDFASLPVTHDELLKDDWFHHRNICIPFLEPLCTLNEGRHVIVRAKNKLRARDLPLAAQEIEAPTSASKSLRS